MLRGIDTFLAELGLERAEPTGYEWGDDPGSQIRRASLTHEVLHRMLESAEALAPLAIGSLLAWCRKCLSRTTVLPGLN